MDPNSILLDILGWLTPAEDFFADFATAVGAILVAAAAVFLAFIGWRAFRSVCNKV